MHQEPQLFPNLTVGENIVAGHEAQGWRWPKTGDEHHSVFEELGILELRDTAARRPRRSRSTSGPRSRARSCSDARVMLFDEPNSALTPDESAEFFRLIRQLADAGRVVMLISHRLTELAANSDRVAVIVDGRCVRLLEGAERTAENIAETLVRGLGTNAAGEAAESTNGNVGRGPGLELVRSGGSAAAPSRASTSACPTELSTALIGVEGSGGREILRACAGLRRVQGQVLVDGRPVRPGRLNAHVSYVAPTVHRASSPTSPSARTS